MFAPLAALLLAAAEPPPVWAVPGEDAVAPYEAAPANAGAEPLDPALYAAFGGEAGVARIVDRLVDLSLADARLGPIFEPFDMIRLRRTLKEQFCYLLGGPCAYTGRDMRSAHADMGLQQKDFALLVEHLRTAMKEADVPFRRQNQFLAILAPMRRAVIER